MKRSAVGWISVVAAIALLTSSCFGRADESDALRQATEAPTSSVPSTTAGISSLVPGEQKTDHSDTDPDEDAWDRWLDIAQPDFILGFDLVCSGECEVMPGRYEIVHRSGEVVDAWTLNEQGTRSPQLYRYANRLPTVADLFAFAENQAGVSYDPTTGLPTDVTHGDTTFLDTSVQFDVDDAKAELDAARDRWRTANLTNYTLGFEVSCFCLHDGTYSIAVRDGNAEAVIYPRRQNGDPVSDHVPLTVDDFFAFIDRALSDKPPDLFTIRYGEHGVPTAIYLDRYAGGADDEVAYTQIAVTDA